MTADGSAATHRVWTALGQQTRRMLEDSLSPSDLQTVLLAVARTRAAKATPSRVLHRRRENRFVHPATVDPRIVAPLEARLWWLLPTDVTGLDLSPVAPLGTCSALGPVDQNRILSTVRGTEVVSDPTNVLAVEAALRRLDRAGPAAHLAACHRVLPCNRFHPPTTSTSGCSPSSPASATSARGGQRQTC